MSDRPVTATFVFVDVVGHAITGLTVKVVGKKAIVDFAFPVSQEPFTDIITGNGLQTAGSPVDSLDLSETATTAADGTAISLTNVRRNSQLSVYVKKRNGELELKGKVNPKRDINNYTIRSPEYHLEAITKLDPRTQLESELNIPKIQVNEVMTIERLTGDLAPFIASKQVVTEVGQVTKDFPTKKPIVGTDSKTGKPTKSVEIEHHYKVVKTERPRTIVLHVLGSKLNYPVSTEFSEAQFQSMKEELDKELVSMKVIKAGDPGLELAAVKAVTQTESRGRGYFENGLPVILYERHKFFGFTKPKMPPPPKNKKATKVAATVHPFAKFSDICNPKAGGYGPEAIQYEKFVKAALLDKNAAIKSCSWGGFQVLGEYYDQIGFSSATDLANSSIRSMDGQAKLFVGYLKMNHAALKALFAKEWETFTYNYNGSGWKTNNSDYPKKMENFYNAAKAK